MPAPLHTAKHFPHHAECHCRRGGGGNAEDEDGGQNKRENWNGSTRMLFGVLYTLAKEKVTDVWWVALLNVIVDFMLILATFLHLEYPWAVDFNAM
eukprot:365785-Chlamydomonas_euryale.AAC.4